MAFPVEGKACQKAVHRACDGEQSDVLLSAVLACEDLQPSVGLGADGFPVSASSGHTTEHSVL